MDYSQAEWQIWGVNDESARQSEARKGELA
jgi:hypothetical protein